MKRIVSIFQRDLYSSLRDNLFLYMLLMPLLLAIGFRLFIPSVQSAGLQYALLEDIGQEVIEAFEKYGKVEIYATEGEIKKRVNQMDDIAGIILNQAGEYKIILEGNEGHDTEVIPQKILRDLVRENRVNVIYKFTDLGTVRAPTATYGTIFLVLTVILAGGMVIGFNVIEEKETQTLRALSVSPATRMEYVLGRSLIGVLLPILQVYMIFIILGVWDVNFWMVLLTTLVSTSIGLLVGFFIGGVSSNQLAGIANLKAVFLLLVLPVLGALLLSEERHVFLYWAPTYWIFMAFKGIMLKTIHWPALGIQLTGVLSTVGIAFLLLKERMKKGLIS